MQKVKKSKKVEEPQQMQEPGKRKRKEVESSKAIAKAGKASKQSKKKDEEDAAVAAAKKKKSKKPVESDSDSSDSSDSESSSSSSSESDSDSDSESDEQIAPETPKASTDDAQEASDGDASVDENHVSNFNLSKEVCAQLETKGITSLYSIQAQCFQPILDGKADVVFGSRFMGADAHRVVYFWHMVGNKFLTLLSNMMTNLNLTDMETCYKMFRREVLQKITIEENRFGF